MGIGILSSVAIGLAVGGATWRVMRFKNGEEEFPLYNDYGGEHRFAMVIEHDGSKPQLPWKQPYSDTLEEIRKCAKSIRKRRFEGVDIHNFFSTRLAEEDRITFGQVVHEAHLHTRHGKRAMIFLRNDTLVLKISSK